MAAPANDTHPRKKPRLPEVPYLNVSASEHLSLSWILRQRKPVMSKHFFVLLVDLLDLEMQQSFIVDRNILCFLICGLLWFRNRANLQYQITVLFSLVNF